MQAITIVEKSYKQADGSEIIAHLIRMGGQDYLTVAQAAEAFDVTPQAIRMAVMRSSLVVTNGDDQILGSLKQLGVLPFKTTVVNLLPRETIDALVRIINTDEAKAAYRQIIGEWREAKSKITNQQLADGLLLAVKVANNSATMSLELAKRVDDIVAQLSTSILTSLQMHQLQRAIYSCAKRMGVYPGVVMREIKLRFLMPKLKAHLPARTWKEIPQAAFDDAMNFAATWDGTSY